MKIKRTYYIDEACAEHIREQAHRERKTKSDYINNLIKKDIKKKEKL